MSPAVVPSKAARLRMGSFGAPTITAAGCRPLTSIPHHFVMLTCVKRAAGRRHRPKLPKQHAQRGGPGALQQRQAAPLQAIHRVPKGAAAAAVAAGLGVPTAACAAAALAGWLPCRLGAAPAGRRLVCPGHIPSAQPAAAGGARAAGHTARTAQPAATRGTRARAPAVCATSRCRQRTLACCRCLWMLAALVFHLMPHRAQVQPPALDLQAKPWGGASMGWVCWRQCHSAEQQQHWRCAGSKAPMPERQLVHVAVLACKWDGTHAGKHPQREQQQYQCPAALEKPSITSCSHKVAGKQNRSPPRPAGTLSPPPPPVPWPE